MIKEEFVKLIGSIGFKYDCNINEKDIYIYGEFRIDLYLWNDLYTLYTKSEWKGYYYNDLTPFNKYFKKEIRSYKLKALLR